MRFSSDRMDLVGYGDDLILWDDGSIQSVLKGDDHGIRTAQPSLDPQLSAGAKRGVQMNDLAKHDIFFDVVQRQMMLCMMVVRE